MCSECYEWSCYDCFEGFFCGDDCRTTLCDNCDKGDGVVCGNDDCGKLLCGNCMGKEEKKMRLCVECSGYFCVSDDTSEKKDCLETHECKGPEISVV
jgi:hypothetical protein